MRPAKTQISLGIRPVWSESSLSAWRYLGFLTTYWAHSEDQRAWAVLGKVLAKEAPTFTAVVRNSLGAVNKGSYMCKKNKFLYECRSCSLDPTAFRHNLHLLSDPFINIWAYHIYSVSTNWCCIRNFDRTGHLRTHYFSWGIHVIKRQLQK